MAIKRLRKRRLILFMLLAIVASMLSGCGSESATATPASEPSIIEKDDAKQPVDEEAFSQNVLQSAGNTVEVTSDTPEVSNITDTTEPVSESVATGSGNYEDYWINDHYFDFTRYMTDNGYWYVPTDMYGDKVDEKSADVFAYYCYDNDYMWEIQYAGDQMIVRYMGGDQNNSVKDPAYWAYVNDPIHDPHGYEDTIQINEGGKKVDKRAIDGLNIVVQTLKANPYDMDPLSHTELLYEYQP